MARKQLFFNVIFILVTSFILKICNMIFKVYLSNRLGAECIGVYQLLMSFFGFIITLAISGVQISITRFAASNYNTKSSEKIANIIKIALKYVLMTSLSVILIVFLYGDFIANRILKNASLSLSLKLLSLSLLPISFSCCYKGYF